MRFRRTWPRAVFLSVALATACEQVPSLNGPDLGVVSLALTPRVDTVVVGDSLLLTATVVMNNNQAPRSINWTSAMSALASVSQRGMVRGLHAGSGFIIASSGSKRDSATVTVLSQTPPPPVPVGLVVVSPASATLRVGATTQLTATPEDANGNPLSGRTITWTSNQPAAATVNTAGLVTAVAVGAATITATSEGVSGPATLTVTTVPVASVTVTPASGSVPVGATMQLSATTKDSAGNVLTGRTITWGTSNAGVATVSAAGLVSGVAPGSATITATSEGKGGAASITVASVPVASVALSPASASLVAGATQQFTAILKDASGNTLTGRVVTWTSSNAAVATVSGSGLVTAIVAGAATISAASEGITGTATVTVTAPTANPGTVTDLAVASVTASSATVSFTDVNDGTGQPASYYLRYAAGTISWGSATELPAITGGAIGTKQAVTVPGLTASTAYQFQVVAYRGTAPNAVFGALSNVASGTTSASTAAVASVTLSPASVTLSIGGIQQFTAILKDASGNTLTGRAVAWASTNAALATVSGTGLATGIAAGSATISATSGGVTGTAPVTVNPVTGGGIVFQSDWSTTGTAASAVTDGGRWGSYSEFNNGTSVQLLSVVSGGPGGRNALQVLERGSTYAAEVEQDAILPPSTDYYVRFYMRNDDTSPAEDHAVEPGLFSDSWSSLIYIRKSSSASGWQNVVATINAGYPINFWNTGATLAHGVWYRFEYYIHYVDATHVQVHPRVYDASGTLLWSDADFKQADYGATTPWNGSDTWTLASYYAAGYSFPVDPTKLINFAMGNNGQAGAVDTGLAWYFAGVIIRTDQWPGP